MIINNKVIDGRKIATLIREEVSLYAQKLKALNIVPGLAVIQVGDDQNSTIYVNNKIKAAKAANIQSFIFKFDNTVTTKQLMIRIEHLNNDLKINGILVQLPLPSHIDITKVINTIHPAKDVDGLTVENVGKLVTRQNSLLPCTPQGCLLLIKSIEPKISGLNAVVIGRSNIVGRPMANLLINQDCTVTVAHSKSENIKEISKQADILVVAIGKPKLVSQDWVKQDAIVIDVGISRTTQENGNTILTGDVDFDNVLPKVRAITPVPGGVGPMTIACLLKNTIKATLEQRHLVIDATAQLVKKH
jgi:methylenetetrahydrofolate dehydrogenase (NADP+) / methenyltetrahydrofolate cyclohydrolase